MEQAVMRKQCPFLGKECLGEDCKIYVGAIDECVFTALNRTIFKLTEEVKK